MRTPGFNAECSLSGSGRRYITTRISSNDAYGHIVPTVMRGGKSMRMADWEWDFCGTICEWMCDSAYPSECFVECMDVCLR